MPTNDERREVAARLRENEYGLEHFTLMEILGFDKDAEPYFDGHHRRPEHLAEDMRMRLADLIEPEPERTCLWKRDANGIYEGRCGIMWEFVHGNTFENGVRYCPKCGAKVMV